MEKQEETEVAAATPSVENDDSRDSVDDQPTKRLRADHEHSGDSAGEDDGTDGPKLSKRQLKRLKRDQQWLAGAETRREKRKEKREQQKEKRRVEREQRGSDWVPPPPRTVKTMAQSSEKQRVVVDMCWEDYMTVADLKSAMKQVERCYSVNRRAENPLQYYVTNIGPKVDELRSTTFKNSASWDVNMHKESYIALFPKEDLVYLTADSPNVLDKLDDKKVYIIGGLVDHNQHKGVCYARAQEQGIAHAQLPIGSYIQMASRKVLAINHVYEILLAYTERKDWEQAFLQVIPERKGAAPKSESQSDKDGQAPNDESKDSDSSAC